MFKFWAFPLTVALVVSLIATPLVGILAGIFVAMIQPYWAAWRIDRAIEKAERREKRRLAPKIKLTGNQRCELAVKILLIIIFPPLILTFLWR